MVNAPIYRLLSASISASGLTGTVGISRFVDYALTLDLLENELIDAVSKVLLVSGKFRVELSVGTVTLERQGDYITWGPGIDHSWHAKQDSVVITVR